MKKTNAEIVNMIMIYDGERVLTLDRAVGSWTGLTFPGGHVEAGESFYGAAVREAREETGLEISNLVLCGTVHWACRESGERYIEFLYKTDKFSGELIESTREGKIFWMERGALIRSEKLSPNFKYYLPMFFNGKYSEMFFEWGGKSFAADPIYL